MTGFDLSLNGWEVTQTQSNIGIPHLASQNKLMHLRHILFHNIGFIFEYWLSTSIWVYQLLHSISLPKHVINEERLFNLIFQKSMQMIPQKFED